MGNFDTLLSIGSTFTALADLSTYQFRAMKQSSAGVVTLATTPGEGGIGLLQNKPDTAGHAASIGLSGVSLAIAGAAFSGGDQLTNDASGKLVLAVADDHVIAEAVEDASKADLVVAVLIKQTGRGALPLEITDSGTGVAAGVFITIDSSGEGELCEADEAPAGVSAAAAVAGAKIEIVIEGVVPVTVGANTVNAGQLIGPDDNGLADHVDNAGLARGIALETGLTGTTINMLLMPFGMQGYIILDAAADYSAAIKAAIDINSSGEAVIVGTLGAKFIGILMNQPTAGAQALVRVTKIAEGVSAAAFAAGAKLASDAVGKLQLAVAGQNVGALALEAATGADEDIDVLLVSGLPAAGAFHVLTFSRAGALGTATIHEDVEFPIPMTTRRCYVKLGVAPGAGKTMTLTIGTKTVVITEGDTKGQNLAMDEAFAADTDFDAAVVDDGAGADLLATLWVQETNPA